MTLTQEQLAEMDRITGYAQYFEETPVKEDLRTKIINKEPEKAKEWLNKGEITPFEHLENVAKNFNGTYDNIAPQKEYKPELNAAGRALSDFLDNKLPFVKKAVKKLNESYDSNANIEYAKKQFEENERKQGVDYDDKTKRYEIARYDKTTGLPVYREIDLLDKIGFLEASRNSIVKGTGIGALGEFADTKKEREILKKIYNNEQIRQDELDFVNRRVSEEQEKIVRGYTLGGKIGEGVGYSLGFTADMLVGTPLFRILGGGALAGKAGYGIYKGTRALNASKNVALASGKVAKWGVESLGGAGVTTAINPQRTAEAYQKRMLENETEITDKGLTIFSEAKEKPATAFFKSLAGVYISYFTEMGGGAALSAIAKTGGKAISRYAIAPVTGKLFEKFPKLEKLINSTTTAFAKKYEEINKMPIIGTSTGWIKDNAHFDGFLEECGEEALEDVLNRVVGTHNDERSLKGFASDIFKTPEEWLVIAGCIALQGGGLSAASYALGNNMAQRGIKAEQIEDVLTNASPIQQEQILDELKKSGDVQMSIDKNVVNPGEKTPEQIQIEKTVFEKFSQGGKLDEAQAQALALQFGQFYKNYGANSEEAQRVFNDWFNKLEIRYNVPVGQNQPLKGGVEYNVDKTTNFQPANNAGANENEYSDINEEVKNNIEETFGDSIENITENVKSDILNILDENNIEENEIKIIDIKMNGSYTTGKNKKNSDLDFVVEYSGEMSEDGAFNIFADSGLELTDKNGNVIKVDINPVKAEKSGTLDEYIERTKNYDETNPNIYYQSARVNTVNWTDKFDKVPSFEEIEKHIKDIIESGEAFDTLSPEWKIDIKGGNRVVDKITNAGNFQKLKMSPKKRHNKYVAGIKELINNSLYSHSGDNDKKSEKPNVLKYHYFDVNVIIGDKSYRVRLECEENKNVPKGIYAKRSKNSSRNNKNLEQNNNNVKTVHLYNIKEMKANNVSFQSEQNGQTFFQSAYHGTPHKFDNFSLEHIGTGEGAQSHGYGLYFAENKDVSEGYRKKLLYGRIKVEYKGYKADYDNDDYSTMLYQIKTKGKNGAKEFYKQKEKEFRNEAKLSQDPEWWNEEADYFHKKIDEIDEINEKEIKLEQGQLYEVDIPENDVLLDEDKPFLEQNENIQEILKQVLLDEKFSEYLEDEQTPEEFAEQEITDWEYGFTGGNIYDRISKLLGSDKTASELLNEYGIKGITYNGYQDGRCYVIFDDKAVEVLRTFYQRRNIKKLIRGDGAVVDVKYYDNSDIENVEPLNIKNLKFSKIKNVKEIKKQDIKTAVFKNQDKIYATNKKSNITAGLTAHNLKEIISSVFDKNKTSEYARLEKEIISNVETIFENAIPVLKHPEVKEKNKSLYDVQIIHRFALPVKIGKNTFLTMITVKQRTDFEQAEIDEFAIYDLTSVNEKMFDRSSMPDNSEQSRSQTSVFSITDLTDFVNSNIAKYEYKNNDETARFQGEPEQNLIAGYTYNEVMDKLTALYEEMGELKNDAEIKPLIEKAHIIEDAFAVFENPSTDENTLTELALKVYYIMNNQKIPEHYKKDDENAQRTISELIELHKARKDKAAQEYYGYFTEGQNKNIITIMSNANASTALHELGHVFLNGLNELAKVDEKAQKMLEEVNKKFGVTNGIYTIEQAEKFARSYEAYLYNGKAPNNTLRQVFEDFKSWLKSVYEYVTDIPGADISGDVQDMFDRMFGDDTYYSEKRQAQELLKTIKKHSKKQKTKKVEIYNDKNLDERQKRHKEVCYEIVSAATGKSVKYLKTIFETDSKRDSFGKKREAIQELIEKVDDKIATSNGFQPHWAEFYTDPGVNDVTQTRADEELVQDAFDRIINKKWKNNNDVDNSSDERAEYMSRSIDNADREYKMILSNYKQGNRNVTLAAYYEWLEQLPDEIKQDYEDRFMYDVRSIERSEHEDKFEKAKRMILTRALELQNKYSIEKSSDFLNYKELVKEVMNNLSFLQPTDKAKLTANILDIQSVELLTASIDNILDIAKTMEDVKFRRNLESEIHKELQSTKNIKKNGRTVGKYNYKTNKIFEQLRELDKLTPEIAHNQLLNLLNFARAEETGLSYEEKLYNKFLSYKAGGRTFQNTELMKSLYDEIVKLKLIGKTAKSEIELQEKYNEIQDIDELIDLVQSKKEGKIAIKTYINWFGNLESTLNAIFNKSVKEKYGSEILYAETQSQAWQHEQKQNFEKEVAKIYNLPEWNWDKRIIEYLSIKKKYPEIRRKYDPKTGEVVKTRSINRELTRMDVINAYIFDKNKVLHERLKNQFGEDTLESMFDELTDEDIKLANLCIRTAESFYKKVNKAFIEKYGIDLPKVSCYFPSTPERGSEVDLYNEYSSKSLNQGFTKQRSNSEFVPMDFHNPIAVLYSHIDGVAKFSFLSESLDRANLRFRNTDLKRAIIDKYGKDAYRTLEQCLINITYKKEAAVFSGVNKMLHNIASNWIQGNVNISPMVGLKQLLSASNYSIDMPYMTWQIGFLNAIAHPKATIDYMMKIPYIKARFEGGLTNEFLKEVIENSAYAKTKKLKDLCSIFIKTGDIGAIIFGGKPYVDYLIKDKGMSEQEAIKQFIISTNRSQQSSAVSSLSNFQISASRNPVGSLFIAYKNSPQQYVRMCGDAIVSVANGDITKKQCLKMLWQFGYFQPLLYAIASSGSLLHLLFTGDDDDLKKDISISLFNLGSDALPVVGDIYKYAVNKMMYKQKYMPQNTPLLGDVEREIARISKDDATVADFLQAIGYIGLHVGAGYNSNKIIDMATGVGDITEGDIEKGSLKLIGYTDKRAEHITDD